MNGLDAIIDSILGDARVQAGAIREQAEAEASRIRADADGEADALLRSMEAAAASEADALLARAESSAGMSARRVVLDARRQAVSGLVDRAVASLAGLPSDDKIRLYAEFLADARGGETVVFCASDLREGVGTAAIAAAREARAARGLPPIDLTLSDVPGDFTGGLVLRRSLVEDNLTFEMLTRQSRDDLETFAATLIEK